MESFISIEGKRKEYIAYEETTDYVITHSSTTCTIKRAASGSNIPDGVQVYLTYSTGSDSYHEPTGGWEVEPYATTATSGAAGSATVTIGTHTLVVGNEVIVKNITPTAYNGIHTITAVAATTISYVSAATGSQTVAGQVALKRPPESYKLIGTTPIPFVHQSENVDTNSILVENIDVNDQRLVSIEEGLFIPQVDDFNDRFSATSTIVSYSENNKSIKSYRDGSIKTKDQEDYYMETYFPQGESTRKRLKNGFSLFPDVIGKSAIDTKFATRLITNDEGGAMGEADIPAATEVFTDV